MEQKLSNELYEPPEVALCLVQVERGFYGSGSIPSTPGGGGGGGTTTTTDVGGGIDAPEWGLTGGSWE